MFSGTPVFVKVRVEGGGKSTSRVQKKVLSITYMPAFAHFFADVSVLSDYFVGCGIYVWVSGF